MKTITIQIGKSDDKLTQREWSAFFEEVQSTIECYAQIHFAGASVGSAKWQNAAWVVNSEGQLLQLLKTSIAAIRKYYGQESVAWTEGETLFI